MGREMTPEQQYQHLASELKELNENMYALIEEIADLKDMTRQALHRRRTGLPPLSELGVAMRLWDYIIEHPGCMKKELRPLVNKRTSEEFERLITVLAENEMHVYILNGRGGPGVHTKEFYTREQLEEKGLWPIPENRKELVRRKRK